ncbi:hypothetical protein F4Z99_17455 [Candidatus Poribacteria bacterium]|nr:hypothetical protein [Candidatus Poribacteria bacterium]
MPMSSSDVKNLTAELEDLRDATDDLIQMIENASDYGEEFVNEQCRKFPKSVQTVLSHLEQQ